MKVCRPGLHLTLGVFYQLFKLLEDACHELDVATKFRDNQAGGTFDCYHSAVRQQNTLRESTERLKAQVEGMEQLVTAISIALPAASSQPAYSHLCCELQHRRQRLKSLVKQTFKYIHRYIHNDPKTQENQIKKLYGVTKKSFEKGNGPFVRALDRALFSLGTTFTDVCRYMQ